MNKFYTTGGPQDKLFHPILLLFCCAILNFIIIPESLAQLSSYNTRHSKMLYQQEAPSVLQPKQGSLLLNNYELFRSPVYYSLSSPALLLKSFLSDSTDELSKSRVNPYLLEENPAEQTITLNLPKVGVGKIMIAVYSPEGELLMKKSVRNQEEREMEMDLKELQAGDYFLEIQAAEIYEKFSFMLE